MGAGVSGITVAQQLTPNFHGPAITVNQSRSNELKSTQF